MIKKTLNLKLRFILFTTLLISIVIILSGLVFSKKVKQVLDAQFEKRINSISNNISYISAYGVLIENKEILNDLVNKIIIDDEISAITITNTKKELLAQSIKNIKTKHILEKEIPVKVDFRKEIDITEDFSVYYDDINKNNILKEETIGYIYIKFSKDGITNTLNIFYLFIISTTILLILGGMVLALFLYSMIISPIQALVKATERIAQGDLDYEVDFQTKDEIGKLAISFNKMTKSLKESKIKLEETFQELARKERLASLGELTSGIAHEIRNPLGIILSAAQIVSNFKRPETIRAEAGKIIIDEVKRLDNTLTHFLNFARPKEPCLTEVDLKSIIEKMVNIWLNDPENKEIKLVTEVDVNIPKIYADPNQIEQVLLNLFINSKQAMNGEGEILIKTNLKDDKYVELIIIDNGPGIPKEIQSKIFDPFFTTKDKGTGLGLSIVYQIIKAHNGKIEVISEKKEGTEIRISLPY